MPAFELHIWGPAFRLPSIDAECLAAVAYLHHAVPSSEWTLIPSSNPSVTPSNHLPALRSLRSGSWTCGYNAITSHLSSLKPEYNLDAGLTPAQQADTTAYSAFISSRLGALLDVSFYALPKNWAQTIRPAYSAILPFPLTWTVPTTQRAAALDRAGSLLLHGLTLGDDGDNDETSKDTGALDAAIKRLPTSRKRGVLQELGPDQATIRLHAAAVDALSTLEKLRMEGQSSKEDSAEHLRLFPGPDVTSLDCLALAYLALIRSAPVPQDFLRKALDTRFPVLAKLTDELSRTCFEAPGQLPWSEGGIMASARPSVAATLSRFCQDLVTATPALGDLYSAEKRHRAETANTKEGGSFGARTWALAGGIQIAAVALASGVWYYRNLPPFGAKTQTWVASRALGSRLDEFGVLGAMLDFSLGGAPEYPVAAAAPSRIVETDVSVD